MVYLVWTCIALALLEVNSYVLLTANVEDVQAIAHQVAESPVVDQIKSIWRRAYKTFNKHYEKKATNKMRADDEEGSEKDPTSAERAERREAVRDLVELGRNASNYLKAIEKIVEKI